jgi:hypothetical protein
LACNKFTGIDGKACNDIPEAQHARAILVKLDEINIIDWGLLYIFDIFVFIDSVIMHFDAVSLV